MNDRDPIAPPGLPRLPRPRLRLALGLALCVAAVVAIVAVSGEDEPSPEPPARRAGPVLDLLAWLPATSETRRAFAVWTPDRDAAATPPAAPARAPLPDRLALVPMPWTLGRSAGWRDAFGWNAADVTGWSTSAAPGALAILDGDFDLETIERRLDEHGYRSARYRGVAIWSLADDATPSPVIDGDAVAAANAIALLDGRLVTAFSVAAVRAALDAAHGDVASLADDAAMAPILRAMAPMSGVMVIDAADHAAACDAFGPWAGAGPPPASGRYVVVAYGRLGDGGPRRTLVTVSFPTERAAIEATGRFEIGWTGGVVNAAGAGGAVETFGTVSSVNRSGALLIAELIDGREDGWARAGIRYAIPVCEAAASALPPISPASPAP